MSALRTQEINKLNRSYSYETKPTVFQSYHFEWTIRNFGYIMNNIQWINKPFFPPERDIEHEWLFEVGRDYSNIYFTLYASKKLEKYVDVSFCLKSLNCVYEFPSESNFVNSSRLFSFSLETYKFERHYMNWNYNITAGEKPRDLTIICEISVADSIKDFRKEKEIKFKDDKDISNHRNSILNDDSFKDFSFVIQDQTFHVSKFILALESPVFAAMFKSKMSERLNSKAIITDTAPEIFMKMIEFIYNQKIDQADLEQSAPELLKVAHKYDVRKLKKVCKTFLYDKLCVENALEILLIADFYSISQLREKALRIIKLNLKLFKESEDFKNFMEERQDLVLELMNFKGEEADDYYYQSLGKTKYSLFSDRDEYKV